MKTTLLLASILLFCLSNSFSQIDPDIQWQNTIGGDYRDGLTSIQQTADGGYILGGWSGSDISGDKTENTIGGTGAYDYWIVKTDSLGNILWQNTIGGNNSDYLESIQQTADGGFILGGSSESDVSGDKTENCMGGSDYWIVKTDADGNLQWQNTIGGDGWDELYSILQTADGGYILGGESRSNISGDKTENNVGNTGATDYWIVKTDSIGYIQWQNTIGGNNHDGPSSVQQTSDGGYILGGSSRSDISGDKTENNLDTACNFYDCSPDFWIVRTDAVGNIQWQNTIGGSSWDVLQSVQQTIDGGYIVGGWSGSNISGDKMENNLDTTLNTYDYWIVKTDSLGNIQWQNTIGGSGNDNLYSIWQPADGGYTLGGYSNSTISGDKTDWSWWDDYWIVRTDSLGNVMWDNTIGGSHNDWLYSMQQTADGGYILGGTSLSGLSHDKTESTVGGTVWPDYWIVKLGNDTIIGIADSGFPTSEVKIFPNPFTTSATITINQPGNFDFMLYNLFGQEVRRAENISDQYILERGNLPAGVYFYKVEDDGKMMGSGKVVCLR